MFRKVLIANRGEIAVRIIRTCRDLGISPIAVYSEADRTSLHVKLADQAYCVGPPASRDSYLRIDRIIAAAKDSDAEAIHPGYGFLAENPDFARACDKAGIVFVGPSADAIALMGSKLESRQTIGAAGVEIVPGSDGALSDLSHLEDVSKRLGYPLVIKASAGGGGKGMRLVRKESELEAAFRTASGEAESAFNDPTVYAEHYVENPRHIEVQVLADHFGSAIHLGERECSIQRRHQKLLEECPSPVVDSQLRARLGEAALKVASAAGYSNAGTVEFLVEAIGPRDNWRFYFLEMNTRLQVEHPVTELVTGLDLVREQLLIASGNPLTIKQQDVTLNGSAIECRIYAENPYNNFFPSPGTISTLFEPSGPGVRNDSGVYEGFSIPYEYDPLISKLITFGRDRSESINRMQRALREYKIGGVHSTIPFFEVLLNHPEFRAGNLNTHFIEVNRLLEALETPPTSDAEFAALAAAIDFEIQESEKVAVKRRESSDWKRASRRYWK